MLQTRRNLDAFVAKKRAGYDVVELAAFREAMYHAYLSILSQKPTAIIAPLRGAEPLIKVIQLFASGERKSSQIPMIYYPKVGQMTMDIMPKYVEKIPPSYSKSMDEAQKKCEYSRVLDRIMSRNKGKQVRLILLDEVIGDGSISTSYKLIQELIAEKTSKGDRNFRGRQINFGAIAISDQSRQQSKKPDYLNLVHRGKIREFKVPRLFTTDSSKFITGLSYMEKPNWWNPPRVKRVLSKERIEGTQRLLSDLQALEHNGTFGSAKRIHRIKKIPKQVVQKRRVLR